MPTFTTKAKYEKGLVKPLEKPGFDNPDEVVVTFVKYRKPEIDEDRDEQIFREIEPQYRRIRRQVVKKFYPKFYAKYIAGKKQGSA